MLIQLRLEGPDDNSKGEWTVLTHSDLYFENNNHQF